MAKNGAQAGPTLKANKINKLSPKNGVLVPPPVQQELFHVEKQVEYDGVEMGVLENGIPYLTESGLARMCGVDRKVLNRLAINWDEEKTKPRGAQVAELLEKSGYRESQLFLKSEHNGSEINAYTEPVCLALLEYYAFVSDKKSDQAINAFRTLARTTFRNFIYKAVGYVPDHTIIDSWQHFHDRVDMNLDAVPAGYFSVFREIASMIVPMIRSGVIISDRVVPDISVGKAWSAYWEENELSKKLGSRIKYNHEYPLYYPQSRSNPQPAYAYPDAALGRFRAWLRENYIAAKYPSYILGQVKKGAIPQGSARRAIEALTGKTIEAPTARKLPPPKR